MKKLPLGFCLLFCACATEKQIVNNVGTFNKYQQPYHVYAIGKWNSQFSVYTLVDAEDKYFTVKANLNNTIKKGDVYIPTN